MEATPAPLAAVGHIDIPAGVLTHRFHHEAMANCMLSAKRQAEEEDAGVVGTANTREVELYGWSANVDSHVDKTGYVYIMPLNSAAKVSAWRDGMVENVVSITAKPGDVLRLDDFALHWTEEPEGQLTTAAFIGSWPEPCDALALEKLAAAVAKLAAGDYYGSPRVREGFRVLLADECLAANAAHDELETMLRRDAFGQKRYVLLCGKCNSVAVRADSHWPYHAETSRCRKHLGTDEENTKASHEHAA
jgi:hypothetical protein